MAIWEFQMPGMLPQEPTRTCACEVKGFATKYARASARSRVLCNGFASSEPVTFFPDHSLRIAYARAKRVEKSSSATIAITIAHHFSTVRLN